jgi:hypothetical protein
VVTSVVELVFLFRDSFGKGNDSHFVILFFDRRIRILLKSKKYYKVKIEVTQPRSSVQASEKHGGPDKGLKDHQTKLTIEPNYVKHGLLHVLPTERVGKNVQRGTA